LRVKYAGSFCRRKREAVDIESNHFRRAAPGELKSPKSIEGGDVEHTHSIHARRERILIEVRPEVEPAWRDYTIAEIDGVVPLDLVQPLL